MSGPSRTSPPGATIELFPFDSGASPSSYSAAAPGGRRHVTAADERRDADHEHPAFFRDVTPRRYPFVAAVPRRCEQHVDSLLVQRGTCEWHVVLPADEGPDSHAADVDDGEHRALPVRPHRPFCGGGDELAVHARNLAVVVDVDDCVVELPRRRSLRDSQCHPRGRAVPRNPSRPVDPNRSPLRLPADG